MQNECIDDLDRQLRGSKLPLIRERPAIVVYKVRWLFSTMDMPLEGYRIYFLDRDENGQEVLLANCVAHRHKPEEVVRVAKLIYQEEIGLKRPEVIHIKADFGYDS